MTRNKKISHIFRFLTVTAMMLLMVSCMASYGRLSLNPGLLDDVRSGTLPTDLNYYYAGRSTIPHAVVGIDSRYEFNDRLWFKIGSMDEVYDKIGRLSDLHPNAMSKEGKDILDPAGRKIGIWFSYYLYTPVKVDSETNAVTVYDPYNPNEDDTGDFYYR